MKRNFHEKCQASCNRQRGNKTPAKEHFNRIWDMSRTEIENELLAGNVNNKNRRPINYDRLSSSPKQKRPKESQNKESAVKFTCRASSAIPGLPSTKC